MAVFVDPPAACHLQYEVIADAAFRTKNASVVGYIGKKRIDTRCEVSRTGRWRIDGRTHKRLSGCIDVDLSFTPATNLLAIRRLGLKIGERADARAALFELPAGRFSVLPQTYERISRTEYSYEAPTVGYAAILQVTSVGAVRHYPGLFEML